MSLDQTPINQLITDNIDTWTSTVKTKATTGRGSSKKLELYGVKKLRELILELAVRGKLVPQDPNDEPASILLERIAEEKVQLVKDKKIKKQKSLGAVAKEEELFDTPIGWEWTRISEIAEIGPRNNTTDDDAEVSFVPMPLITTNYDGSHGSEKRVWKEVKKGYTHFQDGDIALAKITPCFENSKAAVFSGLEGGVGSGTTELHVARPVSDRINPLFVLLYLKAPMFLKVGETKMTGSAGQKRVPKDFFSGNPLPFPPINEQHRIVEKVDELMTLCDQLEQQTEASIEAHQVLVTTLLDTLTNSANAEELMQNWQLVAEHFDTLFTTEESIDQLKQTILQLAVMGKLVPQDLNDEPAANLLERIEEEKAQLIKEKKIKKQKALPPITDDEKPFELPNGWEWCRLSEVIDPERDISYGIIKLEAEPELGGVPTLRCSDVKPGYIDLSGVRNVVEGIEEQYKRTRLQGGEVLLNIRGTLGGVALVPDNLSGYNIAREVAMLAVSNAISGEYLRNLILSPFFWLMIESNLKGIAYKGLNLNLLREFVIPLPPRVQQNSIVRVTSSMTLVCDQLKQRLRDSQKTQLELTNAIVEQAV